MQVSALCCKEEAGLSDGLWNKAQHKPVQKMTWELRSIFPITNRQEKVALDFKLLTWLYLQTFAFCHTLQPFPIKKKESLENVITRMSRMHMGATDCSLPIKQAINTGLDVDVFVIMTDNETSKTLICNCMSVPSLAIWPRTWQATCTMQL